MLPAIRRAALAADATANRTALLPPPALRPAFHSACSSVLAQATAAAPSPAPPHMRHQLYPGSSGSSDTQVSPLREGGQHSRVQQGRALAPLMPRHLVCARGLRIVMTHRVARAAVARAGEGVGQRSQPEWGRGGGSRARRVTRGGSHVRQMSGSSCAWQLAHSCTSPNAASGCWHPWSGASLHRNKNKKRGMQLCLLAYPRPGWVVAVRPKQARGRCGQRTPAMGA